MATIPPVLHQHRTSSTLHSCTAWGSGHQKRAAAMHPAAAVQAVLANACCVLWCVCCWLRQNPWPTWPGDMPFSKLMRFMRAMQLLGAPDHGYLSWNRQPTLQECRSERALCWGCCQVDP